MKAVGENWWTGFQTVGSGKFLGVLLLAQFVAILVDFFVFSNTNHIFAFLLASELHIFGLVLLYDLEYDVSDSHDRNNNKDSYRSHRDYTPPPVGTILVESGEGAGNIFGGEQSIGRGLNNGILYLMAVPYHLLFMLFRKKIVGFVKEFAGAQG